MWEYLIKIHPLLPYSLILGVIIAIVIISLKGKLMIKWGKNAIGIGNASDSADKTPVTTTGSSSPPLPLQGVAYFEKKRSCSDCLSIIENEKDKYNFNKKMREDKILNYRMNYTEEKLLEFENDVTSAFEKRLDKSPGERESYLEIESKMFYGLFKDVLSKVKKEIRRSCKENGFCELSDLEFSNFINDKSKIVMSILIRELKNIYPAYGTIVPIEFIVEDIESKFESIHDYIKDIFVYAKQVIEENEKDMKEMEDRYREWASNFVK
jgi:hypothetical protein